MNPNLSRQKYISFVPVAVAWMIIFIHGAIPHHHQQEHTGDCKSVYHCCHDSNHADSTHASGAEFTDSPASGTHNHFICHFSTGPFHSLDNELPFITGSQPKYRPVADETADNSSNYAEPEVKTRTESPENRRGPPQLMG